MSIRRFIVASLLVSTGFIAQAAHAQAAPASEPEEDEVIVTAQKVEQRAVDVPITISVNSGQRLRDLGVSDLDELSNFVPGLNIQEQSANNPGIVIRGITSDSGSAQQGPRVTLYYNGVDISRSRGSYQAIFDVDRVEVIKGPQATLFGTASAVGAISIISAKPKPGTSGALTLGYGNFDARLASGFVNYGTDTIGVRFAGEYKNRDGYVRNLSTVQRDLYSQDQLGLRGSLHFAPVDDFTLDFVATYDRQRNGGTPFISSRLPTEAGPPNPFGPANLSGSPQSAAVLGAPLLGLTRDVYDANLTLGYDFAGGWNFTTTNGFRRFNSLEIFDADGSRATFLEFAESAFGYQVNHEGRFTYTDPKWRASFGWNYFREDGQQVVPFSTNERVFFACLGGGLGPTCVAPNGTVPADAQPPIFNRSVFGNIGRNDTYSVFGDVAWTPVRKLELTAGVRIQIEKRRSGFFATVPRSILTGGPSVIPGQVDTRGQTFFSEDSFTAVLPRFNALYRVNDNVNFFVTVSKGRRSPVVQVGAASTPAGPVPAITPVGEEVVWNYEGGLKGRVGPLSGSIGLYYQQYFNFQVSVVTGTGQTVTVSAGTASNLGFEAEANLKLLSWANLFANVGYISGGIDRTPANGRFAGNRFRLQPEVQLAAGLTIDAPIGGGFKLFATPTVTYRSRIFFEVPNNPLIAQAPVVLANLRAGISFMDGRYELSGFIRNATNARYLLDAGNTGGAFGGATLIPAEPRFFGGQIAAKF